MENVFSIHTADKISILRTHEAECYQMAYYLLQDIQLAEAAAMQTLKKLYREPGFFAGSDGHRKEYLKKQTIRQCLLQKAAN